MTNIDLGQVLPQPASASPVPAGAPAPVAVSPFIELLQALGALAIDGASAMPADGVVLSSLPALEAALDPVGATPFPSSQADEETATTLPPDETAATAILLLMPAVAPLLAQSAEANIPALPEGSPLPPGPEASAAPPLGAEAAILVSPDGAATTPEPAVTPEGAGRSLPAPGSPLPSAPVATPAPPAYRRPVSILGLEPPPQLAPSAPEAALATMGEAGSELGKVASDQSLAIDGAAALRKLASPPAPPPRPASPLPPAPPDPTLQMQRKDWDQPLGQQLLWMVEHQVQKAELRVNPPHLGPLEVRLSLEQDQARVSFFAHDASVREVIESALPRLREMLSGQGVQLGDATVSGHALARQQPGADGQPSRQGGGGFQGGSPGAAQPEWNEPPPVRGGVGLVDHYV